MHKQSPSFQDEPTLSLRVENLRGRFIQLYGSEPEIVVRSPGRAEILGNHTDYNQGFALAAAISRSVLAAFKKRDDGIVRIHSTVFPNDDISFSLKDIRKDEKDFWSNYPRAVIAHLILDGNEMHGADILIDTDVSKSGGVSSSAAFELAIARGMLALGDNAYDPLAIALLCQKAENSPFVNSPCGFLDQGAVAMGVRGQLVFFDFKPQGNTPVSEVKRFSAPLENFDCSFVILLDPFLERRLGETGYVARRKMCEDSLPFWSNFLGRTITSLREVSVEDFELGKEKLEKHNPIMRKRVEHIVYENERVLLAIKALDNKDITTFGKLLSQSGDSALGLYELDENTPQLTHLVKTAQKLHGVLGARNMGGGFSANGLALVKNADMKSFQKTLNDSYKSKFKNDLNFIVFSITEGTEVL